MSEPTNREVAVLSAALALVPEQREAYLDEACAGDAALRQQVEELLRTYAAAEKFLEGPPGGPGGGPTVRVGFPLTEKPGDRIGYYKLLQQIGEGGCGVVYMAEQEEPVRRRVALKVIKLGMDTRQVIARFEAERQALALMDHPNIARVFDAGATTTGRPYFAMELVRGIKITDYCDEANLATRERLDLFIEVCHAIQHAHQDASLKSRPELAGQVANWLGAIQVSRKGYQQAEALMLPGSEVFFAARAELSPNERRVAIGHFVQLYEAWGRPTEAAAWQKKLNQLAKGPNKP